MSSTWVQAPPRWPAATPGHCRSAPAHNSGGAPPACASPAGAEEIPAPRRRAAAPAAAGRKSAAARQPPGAYVLLLDSSSLLYRAYFSIPSTVRSPEGRPINGVHGYLDMTAHLVASRRPDEVVHAGDDDWRPAPRVRAYTGYKAHRPEEPDEIAWQFDVLDEVLEAAGMARAAARGWEAEDAIGSLCARVAAPDRADVVTGDRDLIQVVRDPVVRVLFTVKGVSDLRVLDEAGVRERYGVPASRYADFATLRGDPSDGLPGVRGVGEKTARELVRAYPDLRALVADALAPRRAGRLLQRSVALRSAVAGAADYLVAMQQVVPLRTDLRVRVRRRRRDDRRLDALAKRHGLAGPVRRLRRALDREEEPRSP